VSLIDEFNAATQSLDRILEKMEEADPADKERLGSIRKINANKSAANSESDLKSSLRLVPKTGPAPPQHASATSAFWVYRSVR
jgi:hypothetical protein